MTSLTRRDPAIYKAHVDSELAFLKATNKLEDLFTRGLEFSEGKYLLVPVCALHADDPGIPAGALSENSGASFLLLNKHGARIGLLRIENDPSREYTLAITQAESNEPAVLADAVRTLCTWAQNTLWPDLITTPLDGEFLKTAGFIQSSEGPQVFAPEKELVGNKMILTAGPSISARESSYAFRAAKYGWNNQWNRFLSAFEKQFAEYIGVKYAMATSSCTGALHIALAALGIGPGDEVIVPDITWVSTANAVLYVGATPIFADIQEETWCLDPASFESKITPRTKAVMPVHLYGHPAKMDSILEIAKRHNLFVVEDAAPSIGAEVSGQRTGSFGHFAAFSFQGAKLAVTGEGGMLLTNDEALYQRAYSIWDQGRQPGTFWIQSNGLKYKMANALAAIGLGQLERNDAMVEAKRRIFGWYEEGLEGVPHIWLNREAPWARSIYWMSSLRLANSAPVSRDELRTQLREMNVDTRPVFPAISQYPIWPVKQEPQPKSKLIGEQSINLPSGVCLRREEVDYVCRSIRKILS